MNGSRICYITTNRFALLSVETILVSTIHIPKNILNWFWILFKNVNPWTKRQEKGIRLIFKRIIAHLAHSRALRTLIIASVERLKILLLQAKFTKTVSFGQYTSPMRKIGLLPYPQSGVKALHIVIALKNVTLVSNKKSILVEKFDFAVTQVDNFCKNELITVLFNFFDGKDASLVLFIPER